MWPGSLAVSKFCCMSEMCMLTYNKTYLQSVPTVLWSPHCSVTHVPLIIQQHLHAQTKCHHYLQHPSRFYHVTLDISKYFIRHPRPFSLCSFPRWGDIISNTYGMFHNVEDNWWQLLCDIHVISVWQSPRENAWHWCIQKALVNKGDTDSWKDIVNTWDHCRNGVCVYKFCKIIHGKPGSQ